MVSLLLPRRGRLRQKRRGKKRDDYMRNSVATVSFSNTDSENSAGSRMTTKACIVRYVVLG